MHELGSDEALRQLELLVMRAPAELRFVLATRHDVRLGLHRLRLEGELTEIRGADLRFSLAEARELFAAAGVELPEPAVGMLHERTEGWAAGLRLAALSLAGHPDPGRFAAEFSGSERTVAEYLLAEVLDRQREPVRRLLLRTSVLERVNGELADLLTGDEGGERVLQDLEEANAFVVSLDAARSWFRYHQLFADLLQLELRRTAPGEVAGLHRAAAGWLADHGFPVEAIRHAQAARDWELAARLLADHWPGLHLDGQAATVHELLAGFPAGASAADAELAALAAADELARGSLEAAERYLGVAERGSASVPAGRRGQAQVLLGVVRLLATAAAARERRQAVAGGGAAAAGRMAEAPGDGAARPGRGPARAGADQPRHRRVLAGRFEEAERHLEQGVALARRIGRPFLEFSGLAYQAADRGHPVACRAAAERSRQAIELAERHGWTDEPAAGVACHDTRSRAGLAGAAGGGRALDPARRAHRQGGSRARGGAAGPLRPRAARAGARPGPRGAGRLPGRRAAGRAPGRTDSLSPTRALACCSPWCASARPSAPSRPSPTSANRTATAGRSASPPRRCGSPRTTRTRRPPRSRRSWTAPLRPLAVLAGSGVPAGGDRPGRARRPGRRRARPRARARPGRARRRARVVPAAPRAGPARAPRPAPHRARRPARRDPQPARRNGARAAAAGPQPPLEPLSDSEIRVLRYLPTNLTAPEIAAELYVSTNTVKTHMRNLYAKLGTHRRPEAVERARALGLLAPSARPR